MNASIRKLPLAHNLPVNTIMDYNKQSTHSSLSLSAYVSLSLSAYVALSLSLPPT